MSFHRQLGSDVVGPRDLLLCTRSGWLGLGFGYGDLGGGGPARDVRHRMEKQRDLGVWLRINCLAALPPMAAVFHAFSFPPALPSGRGQHRASVHRAHGLPSTSHREIAAVTRQTHRLTAASPS